jgi:Flp pilus assembly protein TadG
VLRRLGQHRVGQPRVGQPRVGQPRVGQPRLGQPRLGQPRVGRRQRLRRQSADRGSSAVELAILAPVLLLFMLFIIEFALWFDARHAALAAAQEGARVARDSAATNPGWQALASADAMSYYHHLDTSVLSQVTAQAGPGAGNTVNVTVSGKVNGIFGFPVRVTVTGPVECFRPLNLGGQCSPIGG